MSVKKNFVYSLLLTISNYLFPLITYPYVSRVLGVERIGFCAYIDSIINIVSLFAMMGVSYVGLRAIAQNKDSKDEMSFIFSNLFTLNLILCFTTLLIFNISLLFVDGFELYKEYIYWGEFKIFFNIFLIEWLYRGLENFRYITIRSIAIKIIYVILIFVLVRTKDDMFAYYLLSIFMIAGNFVFNWIYKRHYVNFSFAHLQLKKFIPKVFSMGVYTILTSVYATFNISMLGYLSNNIQVGYYNTSLKIYHILTALLTAYSSVMLPRMSSLVKNSNKEEIQRMLYGIFNLVLILILPLVSFFFVFADDSVSLMSGQEFMESTKSLRILLLLLIPFAIDQILVLQILMPYQKDNVILKNSVVASTISIIAMLLLLPSKGAEGSAWVLLISELTIMLLSIFYICRTMKIQLPFRVCLQRVLYSLPYILIFTLSHMLDDMYIRIIIAIVFGGVYFIVERIITKDYFYNQMITVYHKFVKE